MLYRLKSVISKLFLGHKKFEPFLSIYFSSACFLWKDIFESESSLRPNRLVSGSWFRMSPDKIWNSESVAKTAAHLLHRRSLPIARWLAAICSVLWPNYSTVGQRFLPWAMTQLHRPILLGCRPEKLGHLPLPLHRRNRCSPLVSRTALHMLRHGNEQGACPGWAWAIMANGPKRPLMRQPTSWGRWVRECAPRARGAPSVRRRVAAKSGWVNANSHGVFAHVV